MAQLQVNQCGTFWCLGAKEASRGWQTDFLVSNELICAAHILSMNKIYAAHILRNSQYETSSRDRIENPMSSLYYIL